MQMFFFPTLKDCRVTQVAPPKPTGPLPYGTTNEGGPLMDGYWPALMASFTMETDINAARTAPSHTIPLSVNEAKYAFCLLKP